MLYILGIGLGRWAVNMHETGGRQCCRRASVVWAVSWVAMSDSRLYRWWPPEVARGQPKSIWDLCHNVNWNAPCGESEVCCRLM